MEFRRQKKKALLVLYEALSRVPNMSGGGPSTSVSDLLSTVKYMRMIQAPAMLLIDAVVRGDRDEIEERTSDLSKAWAEAML